MAAINPTDASTYQRARRNTLDGVTTLEIKIDVLANGLIEVLDEYPNLLNLTLDNSKLNNLKFLSLHPLLRELSLSNTHCREGIYSFPEMFNLRKLNLEECHWLSDAVLSTFKMKLTCLKSLTFSSTHVSIEGIKALLDIRHLEEIHLTNCGSINPEEIKSLRKNYSGKTITFPDDAKSSSKGCCTIL